MKSPFLPVKRPTAIFSIIITLITLTVGMAVSWSGSQSAAAQGDEQPLLFRTAPGDLPRFIVTKGGGTPEEGFVFLSPFDFTQTAGIPPYLLILDNEGEPVFYRRMRGHPNVMDFKLNNNGYLTYYDRIQGLHVALDDKYETARTFSAVGYKSDLHDIQFIDDGHVLLLIYHEQVVDMSQIVEGGQPDAVVVSCIIQELDDAGEVVFEWKSLDHIDILDSTRDFTADNINYMNCNSIERDHDGNLLLSSRNLDEVTKINRQTGEIMWRMGGKKNEFSFLNGGEFFRQHDARRLPNGNMTLYDNGVFHIPPYSRGLELAVDETNKTVTVVREFRNTPDAYAGAMGNMQRLPGGNTLVGWGRSSNPVFTEFDNQGDLVLQFDAVQSMGSYRAFRFPWQGFPDWPPTLVAQSDGLDVELFFSWNGSTKTHAYMIFANDGENGDWHVGTVVKDGFETSYKLAVPHDGLWDFWVVALNEDFQKMEQSPPARLLIGGRPVFMPVTAADE